MFLFLPDASADEPRGARFSWLGPEIQQSSGSIALEASCRPFVA